MIFYLIGSFKGTNTGKGGHYYSLMHIAEAVSLEKDVIIINIGDFEAPALQKWNGQKYYLETSVFGIGGTLKELKLLCKQYQPEVIHAFDVFSSYFARRVSKAQNIPWILTRAGGENPSYKKGILSASAYYPKAQFQTVFHKEDCQWLKSRRHQPEILEIIPARVKISFSKREGFDELNLFFSDAEFKVMRIARISKGNTLSIIQSINLTKKIVELGYRAKLAIIGLVQDQNHYQQLKRIAGKETTIFTDAKFIQKASDFLPLADVGIGAGRSFMEGCAAGCIMFAPVNDAKYPALVDKYNLDYFESYNFSSRALKNETIDPDRDVEEYIHRMVSERNQLSQEMKDLFFQKYDIEVAKDKYLRLYNRIKSIQCKPLILDTIIHDLILRWFIRLM